MSRRLPVIVVGAVLVVATITIAVAALFGSARVPANASRGQRLWLTHCVHCHGVDGKGSWRAAIFFIRPGDLTDPAAMRGATDRYIFDIIRSGGSPIGRPGMPGFEDLSDADVQALVEYVRTLSAPAPKGATRARASS